MIAVLSIRSDLEPGEGRAFPHQQQPPLERTRSTRSLLSKMPSQLSVTRNPVSILEPIYFPPRCRSADPQDRKCARKTGARPRKRRRGKLIQFGRGTQRGVDLRLCWVRVIAKRDLGIRHSGIGPLSFKVQSIGCWGMKIRYGLCCGQLSRLQLRLLLQGRDTLNGAINFVA